MFQSFKVSSLKVLARAGLLHLVETIIVAVQPSFVPFRYAQKPGGSFRYVRYQPRRLLDLPIMFLTLQREQLQTLRQRVQTLTPPLEPPILARRLIEQRG
jgi:hypothetical protein